MKFPSVSFAAVTCLFVMLSVSLFLTGCATSGTPKPPRERLSSMPQNMPAAWEGQSRMGGMPMSY